MSGRGSLSKLAHVAAVTAPAVGVNASAAASNGAYANQLETVLGRRAIQLKLEQFLVEAHVPQSQALFKGREAFAHRFWMYFLGAVALLAIGLVATDGRHGAVKLIGKWLIGITVAHLLVLWVLPVVVLPAVTTNPWAHLVAAVARALGAGVVTSLVVLAIVGVVFLFADLFIPSSPRSSSDS